MAIAPPTDIILDVARAADPQRVKAATARLEGLSNETAGPGFDTALKAEAAADAPRRFPSLPAASTRTSATGGKVEGPYTRFEAMVLATFIENTLPKDATSFFGDDTAGPIWRGMLAEQIGGQLARSGGVGIARMLEAAHPAATPAKSGDAT